MNIDNLIFILNAIQIHNNSFIKYSGYGYRGFARVFFRSLVNLVLYELCDMFDISIPTIRYRMNKLGITLEQALKTPKLTQGRPRKQ